jgi:molybdenum cofactor cytidylyltransferase
MAFRVSAIILAAGKSQRMGQPKMVLPWRGTTVLGRVVEVFSAAGVRNLFIVTGGDREKVEQEITRLKNTFPVTPVYNPDHDNSGMLSSIWAGLNAIPHDSEAVLIGLGDQPQVEIATVKNILDLFAKKKQGILIPSYNHRRGHPILLDSAMIRELKTIKPESSLRDFLNTHNEEISYIAADISVLQDLDTPQDYEKYKGKIEPNQGQNNGNEKL